AVLFVRIEEMKNKESLVMEPFHVAGLAVHHADFGAVLRLPDEQRLALGHILEMEDRGTDEEDRVVVGRDKVVHHHRQAGVYGPRLEQLAVAAGAIPRDVRRERRIAEEQ